MHNVIAFGFSILIFLLLRYSAITAIRVYYRNTPDMAMAKLKRYALEMNIYPLGVTLAVHAFLIGQTNG